MGKERFATLAEQDASGEQKNSAVDNASAEHLRPGKWYLLAACVLLADQVSKAIASNALIYAVPERVFFWLNLSLHHNEGAAFSFLSEAGGWQRWFFTLLAIVVCGVLVTWIRRLFVQQWALALALGLVLGGALGNLADRLRLGYVVDFISVHYDSWYFPTFNVADAAISVGAVIIVLDSFRPQPETSEEKANYE